MKNPKIAKKSRGPIADRQVPAALPCRSEGGRRSAAAHCHNDYPVPGDEITVVGTFDSYQEEHNGNYYVYLVLRNASFV